MITIHNEVKKAIPNFKLGYIEYENTTISTTPQMFKGRFRLFQESIYFDLLDQELKSVHGIAEWRKIFKQTGTDPSRYRPSAEALYRRIKKGQFLEPVNSGVDINNFFSLKYSIPFGLYDNAKLNGQLSVMIGKENDHYTGLNGRIISLDKILHTADENGPFGSPYIDSTRSPISEATTDAIQLVYLLPSIENNEAVKMLESVASMFVQINGGNFKVNLVS
ncbi:MULTISPECIES: B3/4 domain-containing protein [Sutcliffiella]|nr:MULTISPECIES: phenylalanine--tRNA ligase beta subunit-related protein [Sutcliffiella]MED4017607.1 phenylalanine--tRNA ligase beta subunit-related protein [Sutcliffiella cohnii]WBL15945.1 phenylalanine--tRNA ligase beta subunit-related protein [Sutcliffiella sp. NC1]